MRTQLIALALATLMFPSLAAAEPPFKFRDVGDETGLFPAVAKIAGHGAGWGDVDGDGFPDLYVGTFGGDPPYGSKSNQFFRNIGGKKFQLDDQAHLRIVGRSNGGYFADLDNDGDLDLYTTNHAIEYAGQPHFQTPNSLFRNDGAGKFSDVSAASSTCPKGYACRSVSVLDYDGDGLLDLLVGEDFFQGGMSRSRLYRNLGGLKFEDATQKSGLPDRVTGFGVAAGDVNADLWPDIFLAGRNGGNRLFLNSKQGRFQELPAANGDFQWQFKDTPDDTTCGVCMGDVNRDGMLDIVVGSHFDRPWFTGGVPVRLYLNRSLANGLPKFDDVTQSAGLVPLPMKSPHVEIQDFDNDGWLDIYTAMVKFRGDETHPVIFKNLGVKSGLPQFQEGALSVNDFPTETDRKQGDVSAFFKRMEEEHKIVYTAPGPSCDFDRDGDLDLFLANWWVNSRSLLLRNDTPGGNWLRVSVEGPQGVNRNGIGAVVRIYPAGKLGQEGAFVGHGEIAVGYGYASGQEAIAHFGLGSLTECDVEVILPHGKGKFERKGVKANQQIVMKRD